MKRILIISIIINCLAWMGGGNAAWAQTLLPPSGTWGATTVSSQTVNLDGDVTITGQITIPKDVTLTIQLDANVNKDIKLKYNLSENQIDRMFLVEEGGTLIIQGNASHRIIMDGGADFIKDGETSSSKWVQTSYENKDGYNLIHENNVLFNYDAIRSRGSLTLNYVTIQNMVTTRGSTIYIQGSHTDGMYKNGATSISNSIVQYCLTNSDNGSAIHINNQEVYSNGEPKFNHINTPTSCPMTITSSLFQYCVANSPNAKANQERTSGTVRTNGGAVGNMTLTDVTMQYNYSSGHGGGLYWNAHGHKQTICKIDGCKFFYNKTGTEGYADEYTTVNGYGGGLMLEGSFEFVNKQTIVKGNSTINAGGGICVCGYSGGANTGQSTLYYQFNNYVYVEGNEAVNGAGLAFVFKDDRMTFDSTPTITADFDGCIINKNVATTHGGGIYFEHELDENQENGYNYYPITINLNAGTITGNEAIMGGGIYVNNESIHCNTTTNQKVIVSGNSAIQHGGGICILQGSVDMADGSEIKENTSKELGGGLYVYNASETEYTVAFGGGTISNNVAKAGGGISVDGKIALTTTNTDVIENKATNAGGIYLNNHAEMVFKGGMIRKNMAMADLSAENFGYTNLTEKTAWHKSVGAIAGVGGGVFLDNNTTLSFEIPQGSDLGLYNNRATAAADDIFANGNGTSVTLPDVSSMNLANWEGAAGRLFWAEDYYSFHQNEAFKHDAMYATDGINKVTNFSDPAGNLRYQFALGQLRRNHIQEVSPKEYTNYVCLVLGYEIFYVNIIKEGLKNGESAMFNIYQVGANDTAIPANAKLYLTTLLTGGEEKDGKVYRTIALPAGHWGVRENDWSYTYQPKEGTGMEEVREIEKDDDINSPNDEDKGFLFKNEEKTAKTSLLHHEDKVKNIMGKKQE